MIKSWSTPLTVMRTDLGTESVVSLSWTGELVHISFIFESFSSDSVDFTVDLQSQNRGNSTLNELSVDYREHEMQMLH